MFIKSIESVSRSGEKVTIQAVAIVAVEQSMPSTQGETISMSEETACDLIMKLTLKSPPKGAK